MSDFGVSIFDRLNEEKRRKRGLNSAKYIYIQPLNKEWRPGLKMFPDIYKEYYGEFLFFIAEKTRELIVQAINEQRYKATWDWSPLSLAYYRYKERNNLSLKMWEASGFLKNHIEVFTKSKRVELGFRFFILFPHTQVSPLMVSKVLEWGNDTVPPRPLFKPAVAYIRKHVRRYYEEFIKEFDLE